MPSRTRSSRDSSALTSHQGGCLSMCNSMATASLVQDPDIKSWPLLQGAHTWKRLVQDKVLAILLCIHICKYLHMYMGLSNLNRK